MAKQLKLKAKVIGPNVVISKDSFEYILLCMCSQKFIGELPPNGDAADFMLNHKKEYEVSQEEMQATIDDCWKQGMDLIHK